MKTLQYPGPDLTKIFVKIDNASVVKCPSAATASESAIAKSGFFFKRSAAFTLHNICCVHDNVTQALDSVTLLAMMTPSHDVGGAVKRQINTGGSDA